MKNTIDNLNVGDKFMGYIFGTYTEMTIIEKVFHSKIQESETDFSDLYFVKLSHEPVRNGDTIYTYHSNAIKNTKILDIVY